MQRLDEKLRTPRLRRVMSVRDVAAALNCVTSGQIREIEDGKKTSSLAFVFRLPP